MFIGIILFLILLQSFYIFSQEIFLWPEMYLLPFLTYSGKLPYKDFFEHHGFFLDYILSALTVNHSFLTFKVLFLFVETINLLLVLLIIKKFFSPIFFLFFGFLFFLITAFLTRNMIWYETFISTCILASYYFQKRRLSKYSSLSNLFLIISTFIKPTSFVFLIPWLVFRTERKKLLLAFSFFWGLILLVYGYFGALKPLYDGLFGFNQFLLNNYKGIPMGDLKFLFLSICILLISYIFAKKDKELSFLLSITVVSFIFIRLTYGKEHLIPTFSFGFITVAYAVKNSVFHIKLVLISLLLLFSFYTGYLFLKEYTTIKTERIAMEFQYGSILPSITRNLSPETSLFVWGDSVALYYYLNKIPPTKFPIKFPLTEEYFPSYTEDTIKTLIEERVDYIFVEFPITKPFQNPAILRFINTNYTPVTSNTDGVLLKHISITE